MRYAIIASALLLTPAAHAASEPGTPFYEDPTFVATAALVVFLGSVAFVGGFKTIFSKLDERADNIQSQIDEARALREEASKLMADAKKKAKEADAAADDIIKRAKADADAMMKQAKADLKAKVARREAQAEARIARAESDAAADVRRIAADAATEAARSILSGSGDSDDLFDGALSEIDTRLN
ncbi:MAG: ATP F0F1 synthase subunit B [Pseudomonadota bacterium]|nr:ATP F0F1 synthase subunit B [Pseudomonadota bacterium]